MRFGLLLPQVEAEPANTITKRLSAIAEESFYRTDGIRLTIAYGVAELIQNKKESAQDLMDRAVAALEKAQNPQ